MRVGTTQAVFTLLLLCVTSARAQADECLPTAVLLGEDGVVAALEESLLELGISTAPSGDCPVARAEVLRVEPGFAVIVHDASGRSEERVLSDLRIVATWIDSWLRPDLGASLLQAPPMMTASTTVAPTPPMTVVPEVPKDTAVSQAVAASTLLQLGLVYESSHANNSDNAWTGLRASACVFLGRACVGLLGRYASNVGSTTYDSSFPIVEGVSYGERETSVLAMVGVPLHFARASVIPHVALGAGVYNNVTPSNLCDELTPDIDLPELNCETGEGHSTLQKLSISAELGANLSLPLTRWLAVALGAALDVRPFAEGEHLYTPPPPCDGMDPDCEPLSPSAALVPGEPRNLWRLDLGLLFEL